MGCALKRVTVTVAADLAADRATDVGNESSGVRPLKDAHMLIAA